MRDLSQPFRDAQVIETHTSRVYLTRDRAYKVKKQVVFPFLDYGTLSRRRHFCEEEVRLNRRLAPTIYLGVRALVRGPDGMYALAGPDALFAEEYVVEMRRFPARNTLAARVACGATTRTDIVALAERLAAFHSEAQPTAKLGGSDLSRRVNDCFAELASLAPANLDTGTLEPLLRARILGLGPELDARAAAGLVREGHGDLRAEHVVLSAPIEIVDCIEFDRSLREIDVGCDLAFLVMDLERLGAGAMGAALVEGYRQAGGDPGSEAIVALFAAYRALVRAKVALIRARQLGPGTRATTIAEAEAMLALARRFVWRTISPVAIIVCGVAASGKTTLASGLAGISGLARVGSDATRKRLLGLEPRGRAPNEAYSPEVSRRTYRELGRRANEQLRRNGGVIVDATFRRAEDRREFAIALRSPIAPIFVECRAPSEVIAQRATAREVGGGSESDAGSAVALDQVATFEPLDEVPAARRLVVDTTVPPEAVAASLERTLIAGTCFHPELVRIPPRARQTAGAAATAK